MKKLLYTVMCCCALASCTNLDSERYDAINPDFFPTNEKDAEALVVGDHENGPAAPRFASQPFRDQAHILPVKAAGGLVKDQYPAAGKDGAGNGKALLLPAGQDGRVRVPVLIKPKLVEQVPCTALAFFCQSGIQQQLLRHACREELR